MTKVILVQDVAKLGRLGEVVDVKPGYARNFLIPQGKAIRANEQNIALFEHKKVEIEQQNAEVKATAAALAAKIDGQVFVVIRQSGDKGQLYGSVSARDVADIAVASGFAIGREHVFIETPIKTVGLHQVRIHLHADINAYISLNVARSEDEAAAAVNRTEEQSAA